MLRGFRSLLCRMDEASPISTNQQDCDREECRVWLRHQPGQMLAQGMIPCPHSNKGYVMPCRQGCGCLEGPAVLNQGASKPMTIPIMKTNINFTASAGQDNLSSACKFMNSHCVQQNESREGCEGSHAKYGMQPEPDPVESVAVGSKFFGLTFSRLRPAAAKWS